MSKYDSIYLYRVEGLYLTEHQNYAWAWLETYLSLEPALALQQRVEYGSGTPARIVTRYLRS